MKKILACVLTAAMVLSLSACGTKTQNPGVDTNDSLTDIQPLESTLKYIPLTVSVAQAINNTIEHLRQTDTIYCTEHVTQGEFSAVDETDSVYAQTLFNNKTGEYYRHYVSQESEHVNECNLFVVKNPEYETNEYTYKYISYLQTWDPTEESPSKYAIIKYGYKEEAFLWLYELLDDEYLFEYAGVYPEKGKTYFILKNDKEASTYSFNEVVFYLSTEDYSLFKIVVKYRASITGTYAEQHTYKFSYDKPFEIEIPEDLKSEEISGVMTRDEYSGFYPPSQYSNLPEQDWSVKIGDQQYFLGDKVPVLFPEENFQYCEEERPYDGVPEELFSFIDENGEEQIVMGGPVSVDETVIRLTNGEKHQVFSDDSHFYCYGILSEKTNIHNHNINQNTIIQPYERVVFSFKEHEVTLYNPTEAPISIRDCVIGKIRYYQSMTISNNKTVKGLSFADMKEIFGLEYRYQKGLGDAYYLLWDQGDYYIVAQYFNDTCSELFQQKKGLPGAATTVLRLD